MPPGAGKVLLQHVRIELVVGVEEGEAVAPGKQDALALGRSVALVGSPRTRMRLSREAKLLAMDRVPSMLPSLTKMISMSLSVWFTTLARQFPMKGSAFQAAMTTETAGGRRR